MDQVQTLKDLPPPNHAPKILSFLGFIGFFRHWIPNFASLACPLYQAAKETPNGPLTSVHGPSLFFLSQGHPLSGSSLDPPKPFQTIPPIYRCYFWNSQRGPYPTIRPYSPTNCLPLQTAGSHYQGLAAVPLSCCNSSHPHQGGS
jgi:hypothetical protein